MKLTDIFIHRPVLSIVVSLMILVLGLRSLDLLPVRQFPFTQNAVVTVTTTYTGADPDLVAGFITTPLETAIAQANGIDYMTSQSLQSVSTIQAHLRLNYDPNEALTEISTKVNSVLNRLPPESQIPVITIAIGETIDSMYIGFYSKQLPPNKVTDYLIRIVQPKLQSIEGVQLAEILGGREFALRAWLDPAKLASFNITASDVFDALAKNDFISAAGRTKGQMITINLTAETGLHTVDEFRKLIIKAENGAVIRLEDVAKVSLGSEDYNTAVSFDGEQAVYIGIKIAPDANLLTVIDRVRKAFPDIQNQLPQGLDGKIVYDATKYVNSAIKEVIISLVEAIVIVTIVVFLFLGSLRSVTIPIIAIPLSLIGTFFIMIMLGYSVNLLTLLALVLAIGLVVDDAIIVVENVHRYMEQGMPRLQAAIQGARDLANPIIAISIVLIAVYVPIGFMKGLTGALFTEFSFTLAGAVGISAIIALTLSPMMCSKVLRFNENSKNEKFMHFVDKQFMRLEGAYHRFLSGSLNYLPVTLVFSFIILLSVYFLYITSKSELAPQEDQGIVISLLTAASNATLEQSQLYSRQVYKDFVSFPETDHIFQLDGFTGLNTSIAGMVLKPWDERKRTSNELQPIVQDKMSKIAGANIAVFQPAPLPGSSGLPVQVVITTTDNFESLNEVSLNVLDKIQKTGMFMFVDTDLKFDKLQTNIVLDRDKMAQLGLTMQDVGSVLAANLGEGYVNYFSLFGRSYKVIPQVMQAERLNASQILDYYITTKDGKSIPLSTVASLKNVILPGSLNHFQQLNAATISGVLFPGVAIGDALATVTQIAKETMPQGYMVDYAGQSRQFYQEGAAILVTFFFALIVIFLTLSALFESFRDPLIILISVPMSICGAMIFVALGFGGASINIYTQVGLVTLMGLISKHGILIVQFANDLQNVGKSKREAIEEASSIRLRPILMTTAATVLGAMPLLLAQGAGAVSRYNIGLVIVSGIGIGTLFTIFVVPAMYLLLADDLSQKKQEKEALLAEAGKPATP